MARCCATADYAHARISKVSRVHNCIPMQNAPSSALHLAAFDETRRLCMHVCTNMRIPSPTLLTADRCKQLLLCTYISDLIIIGSSNKWVNSIVYLNFSSMTSAWLACSSLILSIFRMCTEEWHDFKACQSRIHANFPDSGNTLRLHTYIHYRWKEEKWYVTK